MLTLYTYFRSSAAFRVRIALNVKGITWQPTAVSLPQGKHREDNYREINPQALLPTLVDGDLRLNQSLAIIEYLDEVHPGPRLLPADPAGRARVRAIAQLVACEIHPLNNLRVLQHLKREIGLDQPRIDQWYRHWCHEGLSALERQLGDGGSGRFCHGDTLTMADCCLVPQIFNAQRFDTDLTPFPATMRIFAACMALEPVQRAQPSAQADAA